MNALWSVIQGRAGQMDAQRGQPRFATVTSYDPNTGAAQVTLQPEGTLSGWLPVLSAWVGAGWGLHIPLAAGDQVLVVAHEGNAEHGVIVGRAFSNAAQPPGVSGADAVLRSKAGASIALMTNGQVTISDPSGSTLTFLNNGTVSITGDVTIAGDGILTGTLTVNGKIELNGTTMVAP